MPVKDGDPRAAELVMIRIEVTDRYGMIAALARIPQLSKQKNKRLAELASHVVAQVARSAGCDEDYARKVVICDLMRLIADAEAYEREAERRGMLPL